MKQSFQFKILKSIGFFSILVALSLNFAFLSFAQGKPGGASGNDQSGSGSASGNDPVVSPSKTTLDNPIDGIDTIDEFIKTILDIVLTVGVPIVALFIIYAGFLFVSAQGDPGKIKTAKETLTYTLIGAAILLGAWTIAQALKGTIEQIKS